LARTVVAITGASSGIGEVYARRLAPEHDLILIARREERLEALAAQITATTEAQVETIVADLTNEDDLNRVAARLMVEERLVLLVNNAGFGTKGRFWEASLVSQERMHKLHVMATVKLTHAVLQRLVAANRGAIINVASVSAYVRAAGSVSYSATKSWMTAFTEGLYLELKSLGSNVLVQALCPGFTYSEFHDRLSLERTRVAPESFWMSAEYVVEASLAGLRKRQLFVIPGWRYRVLTAVLSKLPSSIRIRVEEGASQKRRLQLNGK
jgi:uncharacterized protein